MTIEVVAALKAAAFAVLFWRCADRSNEPHQSCQEEVRRASGDACAICGASVADPRVAGNYARDLTRYAPLGDPQRLADEGPETQHGGGGGGAGGGGRRRQGRKEEGRLLPLSQATQKWGGAALPRRRVPSAGRASARELAGKAPAGDALAALCGRRRAGRRAGVEGVDPGFRRIPKERGSIGEGRRFPLRRGGATLRRKPQGLA